MHPKLAEAVQDKIEHPKKSYSALEEKYDVPASTINDHVKGKHSAQDEIGPRALPIPMELELVKKINDYADRGTLLTPGHVKDLAQRVATDRLGINWGSTFIKRYHDQLSSRFRSHQELARIKADTPECRRAFYDLMKGVFSSYSYSPFNIYNMDETGFKLGDVQKRQRVSGDRYPRRSQAKPTNQAHITVVATIGIEDAPVPPLLIFSGTQLQHSWFQVRRDDVRQLSIMSDSGWTNSYISKVWLEECFDPYTRDRAGRRRRLLILDGAEPHIKMDFLSACWDRNIVCVILPAHMSGIFQPLDVDFFNQHKAAYRRLVDNYHIASFAADIPKGLFYGWHQQAWRQTATKKQLKGAWRKSGLWPLDRTVMGVEDEVVAGTPPPNPSQSSQTHIETPTSLRILRSNNSQVRTGEINPKEAYLKLEKAYNQKYAEAEYNGVELGLLKESIELQKEARGSKKKVRHPHGHVYDPEWRDDHPEEVAERLEREREATRTRKRKADDRRMVETFTSAGMEALRRTGALPSS